MDLPRVLIGTPSHSRRVHIDYTASVVESIRHLRDYGIEVEIGFRSSSILPMIRCQLIMAALCQGFSHLLLIDDDVGWDADTPARLLAHERDVVGCVVQASDGASHNIAHPRPAPDAPGLLEVDAIGTAYLLLSRHCLERMETAYPGRAFEFVHDGEQTIGEDFTFCCRWRGLGGRVFADPVPRIRHHGHAIRDLTWSEAKQAGKPVAARPQPVMAL